MAYTFGAATTDGIALPGLPTLAMGTSRVGLVTCWVRPTTLTAGRVVWSNGAVWTLAIDTTTTSLRLTADAATTDGVWTFPANLATNKWTFVAVLYSLGTGPAGVIRAWVGDETAPPTERTVTIATAAVSTWVSGGSTFTVGNGLSAAVLAFQGDIGGFTLTYDNSAQTPLTVLGISATSGAVTQAEADVVFNNWVVPLWRGDIAVIQGMGRQLYGSLSTFGFNAAMSLDTGVAGGAWVVRGGNPPIRATVTGATSSANRTPRSFDDQNNNMHLRTRRGYRARMS